VLPSSFKIWRTTPRVSFSTTVCLASLVLVADKAVASPRASSIVRVALGREALLRRDYHSRSSRSMVSDMPSETAAKTSGSTFVLRETIPSVYRPRHSLSANSSRVRGHPKLPDTCTSITPCPRAAGTPTGRSPLPR
jgi:hypothetical protein